MATLQKAVSVMWLVTGSHHVMGRPDRLLLHKERLERGNRRERPAELADLSVAWH